MIAAVEKPMSFDEFVAWLPQDRRYELIDGIVVEMQPTGDHESFSDLLLTQFTLESHRLTLPYSFPSRALLKAPGWNTGYLPDVLVLNKLALVNQPRWQREATITKGSTVKLVVEVVSTNWETDYARKLEDYGTMGIAEYWIADYLGLGGKKSIGFPKQPALSVYTLTENGEYQVKLFRGGDRIVSPTFPELDLTAEQVVRAGQ